MDTAQHIALCTRLSRFVQLQTLSEQDATLLCAVCSDLAALYDRYDVHMPSSQQLVEGNSASLLGGAVSSATMDDIVLLATQKLLLGVVTESEPRVKESVLLVLARTLARCERQVRAYTEHKLLGFLQSCALYLPVPDAALDRSSSDKASGGEARQHASRSLQSQSEELRLHALTSLQLLLRHKAPALHLSSSATGATAASSERTHFFAYVVSSLLHIAQYDRCRAAALLAVETLASLVAFLQDAVLLRQFFPGVSVGMWRTVNAPQQSSKVAAAALQCLAQSISLCISDAHNQPCGGGDDASGVAAFSIDGLRALAQQQQQRQQQSDSDQDTDAAATSLPPSPPLADPWLHETAVNVDVILSKLFSSQLLYQRSWRIRNAMVALCGAVVLSSRVTLRDSFFRCYEELLVLRVDAISAVAMNAQRVFDALQSALSTTEWLDMVPVLAERFEMHLSTLSLQCGTHHESTSVSIMRKLIGYVRFLGPRLGAHLDAAMDAIYAALCQVLEFDAIDIDLVLHQTLRATDGDVGGVSAACALTTSQFQKRLRFFHEQESVDTLTQLLLAIGSVTTPALFTDCAFALLQSSDCAAVAPQDRHAEVFLVLNGLLRAHAKTAMVDRSGEGASKEVDASAGLPIDEARAASGVDVHLVGRILEDLLALERWSEHTGRTHESPQRRKSEVAQRALMVECVGVCIEILQRGFDVFLLHTLYPLVEKLGSPDVEVERAALETLRKIAFFSGCASLEALLEANMDYFVDALCSRLAHLEAYPVTARVVEGLLRHTRIASLPLVDEVATALLQSVDLHQDSAHIGSLLRALKLLLASMAAERYTSEPAATAAAARESTTQFGTALVLEPPGSLLASFIKEIRILTDESSADDEAEDADDKLSPSSIEEVHDDGDDGDDNGKDASAKVKGAMPVEYGERSPMDSPDEQGDADGDDAPASPYTALILEILDRSGHFLSESEPIACCLVLSMMDEGVMLLRDSRKELLPLIHRLWPTILHRLAVPNKPILTATVRLVTTLAVVAGDFIGDRFVESVWPALRPHLNALEARESSGAAQLTRSMLLLAAPSANGIVVHDPQTASSSGDTNVDSTESNDATPGSVPRARRTPDSQLLLAALKCLATVSSKSSAVTQIVPDVAAVCRKFLSAQFPREVVDATQRLFRALMALNGDEVFCALAPLARWTPPVPPSARFPAYSPEATSAFYRAQLASGGGAGASASLARDNAAWLLAELQRSH